MSQSKCFVPGCEGDASMDRPAFLCREHWDDWFLSVEDDADRVLQKLLDGEHVKRLVVKHAGKIAKPS